MIKSNFGSLIIKRNHYSSLETQVLRATGVTEEPVEHLDSLKSLASKEPLEAMEPLEFMESLEPVQILDSLESLA